MEELNILWTIVVCWQGSFELSILSVAAKYSDNWHEKGAWVFLPHGIHESIAISLLVICRSIESLVNASLYIQNVTFDPQM